MCVYSALPCYSVQTACSAKCLDDWARLLQSQRQLWGFVGPVCSDVALPGFMQKVGAPLLVCRFLLKRFGVEVLVFPVRRG